MVKPLFNLYSTTIQPLLPLLTTIFIHHLSTLQALLAVLPISRVAPVAFVAPTLGHGSALRSEIGGAARGSMRLVGSGWLGGWRWLRLRLGLLNKVEWLRLVKVKLSWLVVDELMLKWWVEMVGWSMNFGRPNFRASRCVFFASHPNVCSWLLVFGCLCASIWLRGACYTTNRYLLKLLIALQYLEIMMSSLLVILSQRWFAWRSC